MIKMSKILNKTILKTGPILHYTPDYFIILAKSAFNNYFNNYIAGKLPFFIKS